MGVTNVCVAILFSLMLVSCGPTVEEWGTEFDKCKMTCRIDHPNLDLIYCADKCMERKGL